MNDTIRLLQARRSAPAPILRGPAPTAAETDAMLALASRVPDHGKIAPWRFIVFAGDGRARAGAIIAAVYAAAHPEADAKRLGVERDRFAAPLVVGVVSRAAPHFKVPEWEQVLSAGAACMNLIVAANAMGFATAWLTEWYAYDREVLEGFGFAADEKVAGFIHIGQAPEPREDRVRPAIAEIVTRF